MNILSITGILPIPDISKSNDFLVPLYQKIKEKHPEDNIFFFRTYKYKPFSKIHNRIRILNSYEIHGFKVILIPFLSVWRYKAIHSMLAPLSAFILNRRKIFNFLKLHKIDLFQAEYLIPDGYLAYLLSRKFKINYVITTHNESRYFDSVISRNRVLKVLMNAHYVTPLNYPSLQLYKQHHVENMELIPHGIDEVFLKTHPAYLHRESVHILSVGVLVPLKNYDKVIKAVALLKERFSITYTIIGSGPEKENLMALIRQLNVEHIVKLKDRISYNEIPHEMSQYDVFILPSYVETFGRVLFEAMAVGLPTICAKNTGIHGYFEEGIEAISVNHYSIDEIESQLALLISDPDLRIQMGKKAKALISHFTWDHIAEKFYKIFENTTRKKPNE